VGGQLFARLLPSKTCPRLAGVKVCVEILLMAGNAGLVEEGEQVVISFQVFRQALLELAGPG
jgi:hypothetical protein